jgi:hypothetical protein
VAQLYGREWTREALLTHAGDVAQLGGVRRITLAEGPERGVRAAELRTGEGLRFTVLLDRGMDIGPATYRGVPLAWVSPTGAAAPAFYDPAGSGWLRTFHGGLVTTCGLTQAGAPNVDRGEKLGLHGRVSHIPAREVSHGGCWETDDYLFWVQGRMREVSVFGYHLCLTRRITARLGEPRLTIKDRVENCGHAPAPHMMLYHCNLGFPLLGPESRLASPAREVVPRDGVAARGLDRHATFEPPTPDYAEQCFFHHMQAGADGRVTVLLSNDRLGLALRLRYRQQELPEFVQWKQMGQGTYVLGLEPANCRAEGRAAARARGALVELAPGETRDYWLEMSVLSGAAAAARGMDGERMKNPDA